MALPAERPETVSGEIPLIVAIDGVETLQAPPVEVVASVVALPAHTEPVPVIAAGLALDVNTRDDEQVPIVYLMVDV